jgi:hypothetical protein
MSDAKKPTFWKCEACGSIVTGLDWGAAIKGKSYHTTPSGKGECRAVNLTQLSSLPSGAFAVEAKTAKSEDDTDEHTPLK